MKDGQRGMKTGLAALLVAFFALGFFAAGLLSVFWLLALIGSSAVAALAVDLIQGGTILHALGLSLGGFALAQVGYGLGLLRVATLRSRRIPD